VFFGIHTCDAKRLFAKFKRETRQQKQPEQALHPAVLCSGSCR